MLAKKPSDHCLKITHERTKPHFWVLLTTTISFWFFYTLNNFIRSCVFETIDLECYDFDGNLIKLGLNY